MNFWFIIQILFLTFSKLLGDEYTARSELAEESHLSPSKWADIVTVCPLSSPGVFDALRKLNKISYSRKLGALLIVDAVENVGFSISLYALL